MAVSKDKFRGLYVEKKRELTGESASNDEIDDNFNYYRTLVEFCGRDGELIFGLDKAKSLTWEFDPVS